MRVFTKQVKVIGVSKAELDVIALMLDEAKHTLKAERRISPNGYLAIEVDEGFEHSPPREA